MSDLAPLTEDYRVFLHVLDSQGQLLWTEDHEPAVPTSRWEPDQTVEYELMMKVPMYPYIGEAFIAVGLYSPTSGVRVALLGDDFGNRAYRVSTLSLSPKPESSFLIYEEGWHQAEFDVDGRNDWRWTTEQAVLSFRNPMDDVRLTIELQGRPEMFDRPQKLSLVIGEVTLRDVLLETSDPVYVFQDISASDLGDNDMVRLQIRVDQTFSPAAREGNTGDPRELGVRVFFAYIDLI